MNDVRVFYDGGCPLCRACVCRLRSRLPGVRFDLIDGRENLEQRRLLSANGFDLNEGIVVQTDGMWCSGSEAAHALASLHGGTKLLDRLAVWCFRSRRRAELVYPAFRACRRLLLFALNRRTLYKKGG